MTKPTHDLSIAQALSLIDSYAFDVGETRPEELLKSWLSVYHASWIRLATIEALYLGRYKTISIQHILNVWLRMGNPNIHFTHEFERLICRKLPKHLIGVHDFAEESAITQSAIHEADLFTLPTASKPFHSQPQKPKASARNHPDSIQTQCGQGLNANQDQLKAIEICPSPSQQQDEEKSLEATTLLKLNSLLECSQTDSRANKQPQTSPQDLSLRLKESANTGNNTRNNRTSMSLISALGIPYQPDWSEFTNEHAPIHKFIPLPDVSSFFNKLKAFAD